MGWNKYGGWRIGIEALTEEDITTMLILGRTTRTIFAEGQTVKAGDVIGYLGMTGYSNKENVNNIRPHLHFGMQLI